MVSSRLSPRGRIVVLLLLRHALPAHKAQRLVFVLTKEGSVGVGGTPVEEGV